MGEAAARVRAILESEARALLDVEEHLAAQRNDALPPLFDQIRKHTEPQRAIDPDSAAGRLQGTQRTPLHIAVLMGRVAWCEGLMKAIAKLRRTGSPWLQPDLISWTPASLAYLLGDADILRLVAPHAPASSMVASAASQACLRETGTAFHSALVDGPIACLRPLFVPAPPRLGTDIRVRLYEPDRGMASLSVAELEEEVKKRQGQSVSLRPGWSGSPGYLQYVVRNLLESDTSPDLPAVFQHELRSQAMARTKSRAPGCLDEDNLILGWIEGLGFGAFAARDFGRYEYVAHYGGRILIAAPAAGDGENGGGHMPPIANEVEPDDVYLMECGEEAGASGPAPVVSGRRERSLASFANHSRTPNVASFCFFAGGACRPVLYALRPIARGEQIVLSYAGRKGAEEAALWEGRMGRVVELAGEGYPAHLPHDVLD